MTFTNNKNTIGLSERFNIPFAINCGICSYANTKPNTFAITIKNVIVAVLTTVFFKMSGILVTFSSLYVNPIIIAIIQATATDSVGVNLPLNIPKIITNDISSAGITTKNLFIISFNVAHLDLGKSSLRL